MSEERGAALPDANTSQQAPDASRLSFPVQTVILIVTTAITIVGSTWGMRSDLRDIQTRSELRQASYEAEREVMQRDIREQRETMQRDIRELRSEVKLQTLEIQNLNLALARAGLDTKRN